MDKRADGLYLEDLEPADRLVLQASSQALVKMKKRNIFFYIVQTAMFLLATFVGVNVDVALMVVLSLCWYQLGQNSIMQRVHKQNIYDATKPWHEAMAQKMEERYGQPVSDSKV